MRSQSLESKEYKYEEVDEMPVLRIYVGGLRTPAYIPISSDSDIDARKNLVNLKKVTADYEKWKNKAF